MKIIDCSACIGEDSVNRLIVNHENYPVIERVKQPKNAAELLAEMDFNGIDEAVTYHADMMSSGVFGGNELFLRQKENYTGRLHGTIVMLPSFYGDEFLPENLLATVRRHDLFGVRANPRQNRYMFDRITVADTADMLAERAIPVYISPMDGWDLLFSVLKEFPSLTVIITNYGLWGSDGYIYPLVKSYPNVYLDTSDLQEIIGIEAFVRRFGSERLLFGTNYPMDNMGGPLAALFGAKIGQAERENIAFRNFERLNAGRKLK